jgi:hypothetical protein
LRTSVLGIGKSHKTGDCPIARRMSSHRCWRASNPIYTCTRTLRRIEAQKELGQIFIRRVKYFQLQANLYAFFRSPVMLLSIVQMIALGFWEQDVTESTWYCGHYLAHCTRHGL